MNRHQATRIAITAIEAQIQRLAVNANLHDRYHADTPVCAQAAQERARLRQAIEALRQPEQARML